MNLPQAILAERSVAIGALLGAIAGAALGQYVQKRCVSEPMAISRKVQAERFSIVMPKSVDLHPETEELVVGRAGNLVCANSAAIQAARRASMVTTVRWGLDEEEQKVS